MASAAIVRCLRKCGAADHRQYETLQRAAVNTPNAGVSNTILNQTCRRRGDYKQHPKLTKQYYLNHYQNMTCSSYNVGPTTIAAAL